MREKKPSDLPQHDIIGNITTRKIDKVSFEGKQTSIEEETTLDVIDVFVHPKHGKLFIVDQYDEHGNLRFVHNNFVKKYEEKK